MQCKDMYTKEQLAAIRNRGVDMLVSAAAGSGKTTVMIERVIGLIEDGVEPGGILVCTFTKASAKDMRLKAAKKLKARATELAASGDRQKQARIAKAIFELTSQNFCTIMSFCNSLVAKYFWAAGVDPNAELMSESYAKEVRGRIIADTVKAYAVTDAEFGRVYEGLLKGRRDSRIKEAINSSISVALCTVDPYGHLGKTADTAAARELVAEAIRREDEYADYILRTSGDKRKSAKHDNESKRLRALVEAQDDERALSQARAIGRAAQAAYGAYQEYKQGRTLVDYGDLEHNALRILSDTSCLEAITSKYTHVFVDEYQDVNPLQNEIISKVAAGGRLFMVGDVKQSIYGFRGCEAEIFGALGREYAHNSGKEAVFLNTNFRSHAMILDYVNTVFGSAMTNNFGGVNYASDAKMLGLIELRTNLSPVDVRIVVGKDMPTEPSLSGIYSVTEDEGRQGEDISDIYESICIRDRVTELLRDGRITVDQKERIVGYSDIVVLLGSIKGGFARSIKRVLEDVGVPVSIVGKSTILEPKHNKALYNYLKIVDNIELDYELAGVMRKPFFGGFGDEELADIRLMCKDNKVPFYKAVEDSALVNERVSQFLNRRREYAMLSKAVSVGVLASKIAVEHDMFGYCFGQGGDAAEMLSQYLDHLGQLGDIPLYVYIRQSEESGGDVEIERVAAADSVRVMTMHGSKGLEFPCVVAAGANKRFMLKDAHKQVIPDKNLGICTRVFDTDTKSVLESLIHEAAKIEAKKREMEQALRLWYVALTRAQFSLTVIGHVDKLESLEVSDINEYESSSASSALVWLKNAFGKYGVRDIPISELEYMPRAVPKAITTRHFDTADKKLTDAIKTVLEYRYPHDTAAALKTSATKIMRELDGDEIVHSVDCIAGVSDDDRGAERGIRYHAAMEQMWISGGTTVEGVDKGAIDRCYSMVRELAGGRRVYAEKSFLAKLTVSDIVPGASSEPTLVQGVIDLVAVGEDDIIIIDYKTNNLSIDKLIDKYRVQMKIYSKVAELALKLPVRTYIYSFRDGVMVEV